MSNFNINDINKKDIDKIMELINSVQADGNDVMLSGSAISLDKLKEIGFPVDKYKCMVIPSRFDDSKIFITPIPRLEEFIKVYFENSEYQKLIEEM